MTEPLSLTYEVSSIVKFWGYESIIAVLDWAREDPVIIIQKIEAFEDIPRIINHEQLHWTLMNFIGKTIDIKYDRICKEVDPYHSSLGKVNEK